MKPKKLIGLLLAVSGVFCMACIPASAYDDGGRDVQYYNFTFSGGLGDPSTNASGYAEKRFTGVNWVCNVNSCTYSDYATSYQVNSPLIGGPISYSSGLGGTGLCGAGYIYEWTGNCYLVGRKSPNDTRTAYVSGQWSPDWL